ncbi:MAG: glycosyltransferase family 4 protein [candidate division KSB1 bacterium]|nr:glycosyltransferase family 4 protein [candidate division KSB1 bacterium]MDZ7276101.1 glycosyltransferase family 4 protein [candidate division KSB1 bacterium]MDZ7287119.1 glycosyltransferase family 4 protein [candidate division KSB1 bacterium]MDZ7296956.1 glycosyltransferase family 4 protein [candidate division KSB1 bacterium]MDZ7307152.1 glycosyltransferase family 4 protein [candidate division KSB1 bacterium]
MTFCFAMDFHYSERIGGAEVQAWLLAKELARRGFEVHYLAQSLQGRGKQTEMRDGVWLHWLAYRGYFLWRNSLNYYRALQQIAPDMLIQRLTSFNTGVIGWYARRFRKPFAWICTDNAVPTPWLFTRREWHAGRQKRRLAKLKVPLLLLNGMVCDLAREWGMRQASHVFTQNQEQFHKLLRNFGMPSLPLPSGHEVPASLVPPREKFHRPVILWVGNLGANKRPEKFVALAGMLPQHDWKFVMVGGKAGQSPPGWMSDNWPGNLRWLGERSFEETLSWFDQAAVLVNTSRSDSEGFPNTFLQAWLRGVPVVTLEVDPDGIVTQNNLGRVTGSVSEMAQALQELLAEEDRYNELSQRVANFAGRHFAISAVADYFLNVIELSPKSRRAGSVHVLQSAVKGH